MVAEAVTTLDEKLAVEGWDAVLSWKSYREGQLDQSRVLWYYDCYDGRFWPDLDETDEVRAYVNFVFSQCQTRVAVNTANKPTVLFIPEEGLDPVLVEDAQRRWDKFWKKSNYDWRRTIICKDSYIAGTGVAKLMGPDLHGNLEADLINPLQFVVSPGPIELQQCFGCAHVQEMHLFDVRELAKKYGQIDPRRVKAERIGSFEDVKRLLEKRGQRDKVVSEGTSPTRTYIADVTGGADVGPNDMTTVAEISRRTVNGGIDLLVLAGLTVIYHGPARLPKSHPFVLYRPFPVSTKLWGTPFPQIFESGTDWTAKMLSLLIEGTIDAMTALLIADRNSDIDLEALQQGRGINILMHNATTKPPELAHASRVPAEAFSVIPQLNDFMEVVTGRTEAVRGVNPSGVTSGEQYGRILEAATTFLKPEINSMEYSDVQLARLWAEAEGIQGFEDIIVEPGSSAGFRKVQEAQLVVQLLQVMPELFGPLQIARREIFKRLNYPQWEKVVKEIEAAERQTVQRIEEVTKSQVPGQAAGAAPSAPPMTEVSQVRANGVSRS